MNTDKKQNIPKRRFKQFLTYPAWEQRKFNKIFDYLKNNSLSRSELTNKGSVINVHYGDVLIKYGEIFNVSKDELSYILDDSISMKYPTSFLKNGDVIIADAAEDNTVGKCSEITGLNEQIALSGLHTIPCRSKIEFAKGYLGYYMNSDSFHNQLLPLQQGTKVSSISKSAIQETVIIYPKSYNEQEKIGQYFSKFDHIITLHQRKLDKLKDLKKAYLQKMFPEKDKSVPELRFKGFNDDWEQRKLGEVTDSFSGGTPTVSKKEYYYGVIPFIRSAEINSDITELFISEEGFNNSSAKKVSIGDILYALYGATSGEVGISKIEGAINQAVLAIKPQKMYDSKFIMQWLRFEKQNIIEKYLQGGQGNLSGSIVKNLLISLPQLEEQFKIGKYICSIDNIITLHQRKLEKLKNIKKALLNEMFV